MISNQELTVLMPVFNAERFLAKSIESILSQTFGDFQFLIIDDGSFDRTPEILLKYEKHDERIAIIRNDQNIGLTHSLNKGLRFSKSEFIARMDADDISLPNRFNRQMAFLTKHDDHAMVGVVWQEISSDLRQVLRTMKPPKVYEVIRKKILTKNIFCHSAVMMRKAPLLKVGGYDERDLFSQDYSLWLRLIAKYKVSNIDETVLHLRRIHEDNLSNRNIKSQFHTMARSQRQYIRSVKLSPLYNIYPCKSLFLSMLPSTVLVILSRINRKRSPF